MPLSDAENTGLGHRQTHERLSFEDMECIFGALSDDQLDAFFQRLGLATLLPRLPSVVSNVIRAAQRISHQRPPGYNEVDHIIRNLAGWSLSESGTTMSQNPPDESPASAPSPLTVPTTPARQSVAPSNPHTVSPAPHGTYSVVSPTRVGRVDSWLEAGALTQGVSRATVSMQPGASQGGSQEAYVVFYGAEIGIFQEFSHVKRLTSGSGLGIFHVFPSTEAADAALVYAREKGWTGDTSPPPHAPSYPLPPPSAYEENALNCHSGNGKWYAVLRGVVPGVYRSWVECSLNVVGIRGAIHKGYSTRSAAEKDYNEALRNGYARLIARS